MLKIISGQTYAQTFKGVMRIIENREVDLDVRHILIVPDRFTFFAEQELTAKGGVMDAEVVTLNRLYNKTVPASGYLGRTAGVVLIGKIIKENRGRLSCFQNPSPEINEIILDTIMQFKASGIPPYKLTGIAGKLGFKLKDLEIIYSEYVKYLCGNFLIDSGDKLSELALYAGSFSNAHIYFALFDSFTPQGYALIESFALSAKSVTVAALTGVNRNVFTNEVMYGIRDIASRSNLELAEQEADAPSAQVSHFLDNMYCHPYSAYGGSHPFILLKAADFEQEAEIAARTIAKKVRAGARYRDLAILTGEAGLNMLHEALDGFGIPHYIDNPAKLSAHPLTQYIIRILNTVSGGFARRDVFELAFNPYTGVPVGDREKFINYCNKYSIDYMLFCREFTLGNPEILPQDSADKRREKEAEKDMFAAAESVRRKIAAAAGQVKDINTAGSFVAFAQRLTGAGKLYEGTDAEAGEALAVKKLNELLTGMLGVLGDMNLSAEEFGSMLLAGAESVAISIIPPHTDEVYIGAYDKFRGKHFDTLFVLGAAAGVLPAETKDAGLITDADIIELRKHEQRLEPMIKALNDRRRCEFVQALTKADTVYLSYSAQSEPSQVITYIKKIFTGITEYDGGSVYNAAYETKETLAAYLKYAYPSAGAVRRGLARHINRFYDNRIPPDGEALALFAVCPDGDKLLLPRRKPVIERGGELFLKKRGGDSMTNISQLESYFSCPFMHYVKYGLRLKERETAGFQATDIGTLLHKVVEEYVEKDYPADIAAHVNKCVNEFVAEKPSLTAGELYEVTLERLRTEAAAMCGVIREQDSVSDYKKWRTEVKFGPHSEVPPVAFGLEDVMLGGTIDRVDKHGDYVRVVDYKSGRSVGLELDDIYYGRKIQLIVYLQALINMGLRPAGVLYFKLNNEFSREENRYRLTGFLINDESELCAMDTRLKEGGVSGVISVAFELKGNELKLSRNGTKKKYLLDEADFHKLCGHTVGTIGNALIEIKEGYIEAAPYVGASEPCLYCGINNICYFDKAHGKTREKTGAVTIGSFGGGASTEGGGEEDE